MQGMGGNNDSMVIPQSFALNVRVADNFTVGFQTYNGGGNSLPMFNL
jgi:hypothetical protein